jgi:hypothetical protein
MFFTKTHNFDSPVPKADLKKRLMGSHVKIHNLDFEIVERDGDVLIVPHAEQEESIKTLPITHVDMSEQGGKTKVKVTSKMRKVDSGGPQIILIFCFFIFLAAFVLRLVGGDWNVTFILLGADLLIFSFFLYRLQKGYFDYVRKVRAYVVEKGDGFVASNVHAQVAI